MKAEHRKELETNVLADRMGRLLENFKQKPERGTMFWVIGGIGAVLIAFLAFRYYQVGKNENSEAWLAYYDGNVKKLREEYGDKMPGKALEFEQAWELTWTGIKKFGIDPNGAQKYLEVASQLYQKLRDECEGDPVLVPEAIYGQAVIKETLAIRDRKNLDDAIDYYKEVADKHSKSAFGKLAKDRLEILEDGDRRAEVSEVYQDLDRLIGPGRKK